MKCPNCKLVEMFKYETKGKTITYKCKNCGKTVEK